MFDFLLPAVILFLVGSNTVLSIPFSDNLNLFVREIGLTNKFQIFAVIYETDTDVRYL